MKTSDIKQKLLKKQKRLGPIPASDFVSSGSSLLNLACTGDIRHGFAKGHYYRYVGDSSSGKTFLSLTCFAEACKNPNFDDYRLILDDSEDGALMDFTKFFGKKAAGRIEHWTPGKGASMVIEDFFFKVDDVVSTGPCIYVKDSLDALSSKSEKEKFKKSKSAFQKGSKDAGIMTDGKAKINSAGMRQLLDGIARSGSILILISQTRDNIGYGAQFNPKTVSGGRAPKFYATLEMWSSVRQSLKKTVLGKKRAIGMVSKVQVKKNRIVGKDRSVEIPILYSYGIDDVGSMVRYLIDEAHWTGNEEGTKVNAAEFDFKGSVENLIAQIYEEEAEGELRSLVSKVWNDIEAACVVKRKKRYE